MQEAKRVVVGCVIGTRPEAIKMAPIIHLLRKSDWADVFLINTAQHRHLLDDMFGLLELTPDVDLNSMTENQTLATLTGNLCHKLEALIKTQHFDLLLGVGDTTTVFITSLIAFYHHIPFGHIEAGLRTYNIQEPFPEEMNRVLTAPLATWHFAPSALEQQNLLRENIATDKIIITGNTVIDALYWVLANRPTKMPLENLANIIIVTTHRRENLGQNLKDICMAVIELSKKFKTMNFILPVHPNPNVQKSIMLYLDNKPGIHLIPPLKYDEFAHLMDRALLILTDSGGIQEEAPALGKPVVVLRNTTERPAIIEQGVGVLVGTDTANIVATVSELLTNKNKYNKMAKGISPYGDGHASERIVARLKADIMAVVR